MIRRCKVRKFFSPISKYHTVFSVSKGDDVFNKSKLELDWISFSYIGLVRTWSWWPSVWCSASNVPADSPSWVALNTLNGACFALFKWTINGNHSTQRRHCLRAFANKIQSKGATIAEWSKAPDLRSSVDWEMASDEEFGFSGLLVGAWVRIPLLACFQFCLIGKQESSLVLMPTCSPLRVQATDATLLSRTSGSSNCWLFSAKTWPGFTKSKQLRMTVFLCKSKLPVWTFLCSTLQDSGFSTLKGLFVLRLIR